MSGSRILFVAMAKAEEEQVYQKCILMLLKDYIKRCDYKCSCSHGRCSYPNHSYVDTIELLKHQAELRSIGVEMKWPIRKELLISDVTFEYVSNLRMFKKVFGFCESRLAWGTGALNEELYKVGLIVLKGRLYSLVELV